MMKSALKLQNNKRMRHCLLILFSLTILLFSSCSSGSIDINVKTDFEEAVYKGDTTKAINLAKNYPGLLKDSEDANEAVKWACNNGNVELVEFLLSRGISVDPKINPDSRIILHRAIPSGKLELIELLEKYGCDVTVDEFPGYSTLHSAVSTDNTELIQYFIARGANLNKRTVDGNTPLHYACKYGKFKAAKYLVSKGAALNIVSNSGRNALNYAAMRGNYEMVLYLESKGVKPSNSKLIFEDAVSGRNLDVIKHFAGAVSKKDTKSVLSNFNIFYGNENEIKIIDYLLSRGADIDAENSGKETLLFNSVGGDHLKMIRFLLSKGADPEHINEDGVPVVFYASDNVEVLKLLFSKGVSINSADRLGNRLIDSALVYGDLDSIKFLYSMGAVSGRKGVIEPLHFCTLSNKIQALAYLLENGSNVNVRDSGGNTPLHYACCESPTGMLKPLNVYSANTFNYGAPDIQTINFLLSKGAKVDAKNSEGIQPIHYAAGYINNIDTNPTNVLKLLVSQGADINTRDNEGNTPLHYSARKSLAVLMDRLISLGADVNAKNKKGETPLTNVISSDDYERKDKIRVLLSKGALPQLKDFKYVIQAKSWELLPILLFENKLILSGLIASAVLVALLLFLLFRGRKGKGVVEHEEVIETGDLSS